VTKPAVMQGVYVDCKFMAGFKVARISIDIPIEHSNEFLRMFGAPDRANPVHVVVARMDVEALKAPTVPEKAAEPAPVEKAKAKRFDELERSQQAALKCQDLKFQHWVGVVGPLRGTDEGADEADLLLKRKLGIASKKELDTSAAKAIAWDALLCDFDVRNQVRT